MVARRKRFLVHWRRAGLGLRTTIFIIAIALFALLTYWQQPHDESTQIGNNIVVFALVNLNIVFICVLAFLVGRNIVKLIFDRRRNILGSKLRMRLMVAFVGLTLIPTTILFLLAGGLLTKAMEGWFSSQVETTVQGAVEVAKQHFSLIRSVVKNQAEKIAPEVNAAKSLELLENKLERYRLRENLFTVKIFSRLDKASLVVSNAAANVESFKEPELDTNAFNKALSGSASVIREDSAGAVYIRAYYPVNFDNAAQVLVVSSRVTAELSLALNTVTDSFKQYEQLKLFKDPLKSGYLSTLALITGLLIFSAMWIGFYLAREISVPIQRLAEGTKAVAQGNYDFQIRAIGDDEISFLINSFNKMTSDLKGSRQEAEQRRVYLETVLANLAVGVISLDRNESVTSINEAAKALYKSAIQEKSQTIIGSSLVEVIGVPQYEQIHPVVEALKTEMIGEKTNQIVEREISMLSAGRELRVICTGGRIIDQHSQWIGSVLLFDDITELAKAQSMAAWREVAKRIAHEIKNPLTPIQLSSQRLERILEKTEHSEVVTECVQTIVENVASIKRLANEFSHFARMPTAEFAETDLNQLISEIVASYATNNLSIIFSTKLDENLPLAMIDSEQIRRMLINFLDNALDGVRANHESKQISVLTTYERKLKNVFLEISDNGQGISDENKTKIFEPYYTTKTTGTGLGLAIVTTIVSDHQGAIKVYDNHPRGVKFIIDLPLQPKNSTLRKFATNV